MKTGEQFDIFSEVSELDISFDGLPGERGSQAHAESVTAKVKSESLAVVIIEKSQDADFPFHVMVDNSEYTLNAFNCIQGAERFVARHQLVTA